LAEGQQAALQFGNSRIGSIRGPDLVNFDLALQKNYKLYESHRLEFRAEFFNLFNHPNFGLPGGGSQIAVNVPGRWPSRTQTDNRQIEFALKYTF
jgi:hypothetical protein